MENTDLESKIQTKIHHKRYEEQEIKNNLIKEIMNWKAHCVLQMKYLSHLL